MPKVVEVRLGCTLHELTEEQVFGLLRGLDEYEPSVGLGFSGEAAVVLLEVTDDETDALAGEVAVLASDLGLTPTLLEALDFDEYEARAWAEVDV